MGLQCVCMNVELHTQLFYSYNQLVIENQLCRSQLRTHWKFINILFLKAYILVIHTVVTLQRSPCCHSNRMLLYFFLDLFSNNEYLFGPKIAGFIKCIEFVTSTYTDMMDLDHDTEGKSPWLLSLYVTNCPVWRKKSSTSTSCYILVSIKSFLT